MLPQQSPRGKLKYSEQHTLGGKSKQIPRLQECHDLLPVGKLIRGAHRAGSLLKQWVASMEIDAYKPDDETEKVQAMAGVVVA